MKTLEDSVKYTKETMSDKITTMEESRHQRTLHNLEQYLQGGKRYSVVGLYLERLSNWYLWEFLYEYTTNKSVNFNLLAQSTYSGLWANRWEYKIGMAAEPYSNIIAFAKSSAHLSTLLFLGHYNQAKSYLFLLKAMLDGKQSRKFAPYPAYPWFILDLCLRANGEQISPTWNYPEQMGIYGKVLEHWDSDDKELIDELIDKLCRNHIRQSDEDSQYQEPDDAGDFDPDTAGWELLEFSSADYFIFPVEIHAWLSLRRKKGLYCGENLPELLRYEINVPPVHIPVPQKSPLIVQCIEKFSRDYPDIKFEI